MDSKAEQRETQWGDSMKESNSEQKKCGMLSKVILRRWLKLHVLPHSTNIGHEPKFCKSLPNFLCTIIFHYKIMSL